MPAGELENQRVARSLHQLHGTCSFIRSTLPYGYDPTHTHICSPASLAALFLFFEDVNGLQSLRVPTWTKVLTLKKSLPGCFPRSSAVLSISSC